MIRCIFSEEPKFPVSDQHPDAQRVQVGDLWVDYIDSVPTEDEVNALWSPTLEPVRDLAAEFDALKETLISANLVTVEALSTQLSVQMGVKRG